MTLIKVLLFFLKNNNYHQIGNGYLEFDRTLRKNSGNFNNADEDCSIGEPIRLMNNAFAYAFSIATLPTTGDEEIEQNKHVRHVSTIIRLLTNKAGELLSDFDKSDEKQNRIKDYSLNQILIGNREEKAGGRGKVKGPLSLKHICGFYIFLKNDEESRLSTNSQNSGLTRKYLHNEKCGYYFLKKLGLCL